MSMNFGVDTKLQFSGHETFPLRYGWLKKVYDAVKENEVKKKDTKLVFASDDAIARFGVGKNMVSSMRYWALSAGVIEEVKPHLGPYKTTDLANMILAEDGEDPWMEDPTSLWFVHWRLAATPERNSTWYWVFNHCSHPAFDRSSVVEYLHRLCSERGLKKVAAATLKRDVECFARTYMEKPGGGTVDDTMECPLTELALIESTAQKEGMRLVRGAKPTLTPGMFAFATAEFWIRNHKNVATLSFDALLLEPGSPGRVFLLDEGALLDLINGLEEATSGAISWSETAGLKQLICTDLLSLASPNEYLFAQSAAVAV